MPRERFNVWRDGKVHIQRVMCKTCIYGPRSPIGVERRTEMERSAERAGSCIVCHSTLGTPENAGCRGHLDAGCSVLQIAQRMGMVEWVRNVWDVPNIDD